MFMSTNKGFLRAMITGLILVVLSFVVGPAQTATAGSKGRGRSKMISDGEKPVYPGYPRLFDTVGRIDRLTDRKVVIDDSLHRISSSTTFHSQTQGDASRSRFHVGDVVGCLTNSKGEIKSMWLITPKQP